MKTIIYVTRHSRPLDEYQSNEELQIINEKRILSVDGEEKARHLCNIEELKKVDVIYSSHYVRAMATAKYIADMNNLKLNIDKRFGEREFGIKSWDDLPKDFGKKQANDFNFKMPNGESINDTKKRMLEVLYEVIDKNKGKTIMIVSHGTVLTAMFTELCDVDINTGAIKHNGKKVFDGEWDAPELFKLEFDKDNNLISIVNLKLNK